MSSGLTNVALITGVTGQDGSYLAEFLLDKGYEVHGVKRRSSSFNTSRIDHLSDLILHYGDVTDGSSIARLIDDIKPTEIYNLAAQSHVQVSFETPEYTANADGLGILRILEAVKGSDTRVYQASTSELYGNALAKDEGVWAPLLDECSPFLPRSPYGAAKLYAYWIAVNYREAYGIHVSNGILFNHESPRRSGTFVTRKITRAVAAIAANRQHSITLGNLNAVRDWGHARDYVESMWMMLQMPAPDDYVIATGESHSVREFVEEAFEVIYGSIRWEGAGAQEIGVDHSGQVRVTVDPKYYRPTEVDVLRGDATKARTVLGWKPKIGFAELVREMVEHDMHEDFS